MQAVASLQMASRMRRHGCSKTKEAWSAPARRKIITPGPSIYPSTPQCQVIIYYVFIDFITSFYHSFVLEHNNVTKCGHSSRRLAGINHGCDKQQRACGIISQHEQKRPVQPDHRWRQCQSTKGRHHLRHCCCFCSCLINNDTHLQQAAQASNTHHTLD